MRTQETVLTLLATGLLLVKVSSLRSCLKVNRIENIFGDLTKKSESCGLLSWGFYMKGCMFRNQLSLRN